MKWRNRRKGKHRVPSPRYCMACDMAFSMGDLKWHPNKPHKDCDCFCAK